jgi:hypothetical protein
MKRKLASFKERRALLEEGFLVLIRTTILKLSEL